MDIAMTVNPKDKMVTKHEGKIEKWVLRKALKIYYQNASLGDKKNNLADGVGYSWIDTLKEIAEKEVTDEMMANAKFRFPQNTPQKKKNTDTEQFLKNISQVKQLLLRFLLYLR
jgi:asparagine synthase (glutamine-hydrolysing)